MTSYPYWSTPAELTTRPNGYSYTSNPEILLFGETAQLACVVTLLNGELPPGVRWSQLDFSVTLSGQITDVYSNTTYSWTFRLSNGSLVTDQTFTVTVTNQIDILTWQTPAGLLGYYYDAGPQTYALVATNVPVRAISYTLTNTVSRGITINSTSGKLAVDLTWHPQTFYTQNVDYVINANQLYACVQSGTSGFNVGPLASGNNVIDSNEAPWQPNVRYFLNNVVVNHLGQVFLCVASGVSTVEPVYVNDIMIADGYFLVWQFQYAAAIWNQITSNSSSTLPLMVSAATTTTHASRNFSLILLSKPHQPLWNTPQGILQNVQVGELFTYQLDVISIDQAVLTFTSADLPDWLTLTSWGELTGTVPLYVTSSVIAFAVTASESPTLSTTQNLAIAIAVQQYELTWQTPEDLGSFADGEIFGLTLNATTTSPNALVSYGLSGGMLPPNTIILSDLGLLSGFLEYHATDKTYNFEITASDGVRTSVRMFTLRVISQNHGKFAKFLMPLTGSTKQDILNQNNDSLIAHNYLYNPTDLNFGRIRYPQIEIIKGISWSNADTLRNVIAPWLYEFAITLENVEASNSSGLDYETLYVIVRDSNCLQPWRPQTAYEMGYRVFNWPGHEYVASQSGVSGAWPGPNLTGSNLVDGSVIWQYESTNAGEISDTYAVPWMPYHAYNVGEVVANQGEFYIAVEGGVSAGDFGPQGQQMPIQDGSVVWDLLATQHGSTRLYPASFANMRNALITQLGFSTGGGSGAEATVTVRPDHGDITAVTVIAPGSGYWFSPTYNLSGGGSAAVLEVYLGLVTATVISSDSGFAQSQVFTVTQGQGLPGTITVQQTNGLGQVQSVAITSAGLYTRFPSNPVTFTYNSFTFTVQFSLGIQQITVVSGGSGYDYLNTSIDFLGQELLPAYKQTHLGQWVPTLDLATITLSGAQDFNANSNAKLTFQGQQLSVRCLTMTAEGVLWQGNTTWDSNTLMLDGDATRFVELESALETVIDHHLTIFENDNTRFDIATSPTMGFSNTTFDIQHTIFDYYQTLFDEKFDVNTSQYSYTWLLTFGKPF